MYLYHGTLSIHLHSILEFGIDISKGKVSVDFGQGFYLTNDFSQAEKWAKGLAETYSKKMGKKFIPVVLKYEVNESKMNQLLNVKEFRTSDEEWARFVVDSRLLQSPEEYDLVIGPLADNKVHTLKKRIEYGIISYEEAIEEVRQKVHGNQYAFRTSKAIGFLKRGQVISL